MPKLTGPLFSMSASGTLGRILVYMRRSGLDIVRLFVIPENPDTVNQQTIRSYFSLAVPAWQALDAGEKGQWDTYAESRGVPAVYGFNYFVGLYILYLIDHAGVEPVHPFLPPS